MLVKLENILVINKIKKKNSPPTLKLRKTKKYLSTLEWKTYKKKTKKNWFTGLTS